MVSRTKNQLKSHMVHQKKIGICLLVLVSITFAMIGKSEARIRIDDQQVPFRIYVFDSKRVVLKHLDIRLYVKASNFRLKNYKIDQRVYLSKAAIIHLRKKNRGPN